MAKQWRQPYLVTGRHISHWLLLDSRGKKGWLRCLSCQPPLFLTNCQLTPCQTLVFQRSPGFLFPFVTLGFYMNQGVQNVHFHGIKGHMVLGHLSMLLGEQLFSEERVYCQIGRQVFNSQSPGTVIWFFFNAQPRNDFRAWIPSLPVVSNSWRTDVREDV